LTLRVKIGGPGGEFEIPYSFGLPLEHLKKVCTDFPGAGIPNGGMSQAGEAKGWSPSNGAGSPPTLGWGSRWGKTKQSKTVKHQPS